MSAKRFARDVNRRTLLRRVAGLSAILLVSGCGVGARAAPTGEKLRHIGWLWSGRSDILERYGHGEIFRQALRERGHVEGRDFAIDLRNAENIADRLPAMAAELVALPADVVLTAAAAPALAASRASTTVPIVFYDVSDPVGIGLVASLAQPGGNVTGVSTLSSGLVGKRLELLRDAVPNLRRVAVIWNANQPSQQITQLPPLEAAARALGLETEVVSVHDVTELDTALETIAGRHPDALMVLPAFGLSRYPGQVPDFATSLRLPHIFSDVEFGQQGPDQPGALMALGPSRTAQIKSAAGLVDKILRGARPADLPVEQSTQFDFIVNLSVAQRIGLTIPDSVLRQATEVVR